MFKFKSMIYLLLGCVALPIQAHAQEITDVSGNQVVLPDQPIERVADAWFAHTAELMVLGEGNKIVATLNHPESRPWMFKVQPSLNHALLGQGKLFNIEALLNRKVQLAFVPKGDPQIATMQAEGIPTVEVFFHTLEGMKKTMLITAKAMGTSSALQRAEDYNQYLDTQIARIQTKLATSDHVHRPKVLHISSLNPLKVDGTNSLIDDWIHIAGGRNAATVKGNMQPVTAEQILAWQPDIIILQGNAGKLADSPNYTVLSQLTAVQKGQVYRNPFGVFLWDRYGPESALQIQWAAKILHPTLFANEDINQITRQFYQRFFDYPLDKQQADRILQALPPLTNQ